MKYCSNCGESMEDSIQVCPKCGTAMMGTEQAPAPEVNAEPQPQPQAPQMGQPVVGAAAPQWQNGPQQQWQSGPQQQWQGAPYGQPMPQMPSPTDHTAEMDQEDIEGNRIFGIIVYLLGLFGVLLGVIAAKDSKYVKFHVKQELKLMVVFLFTYFISLILCWTIIVPIVGCVAGIVLVVLKIIAIVNACCGKAKEIPIISSFKFLGKY